MRCSFADDPALSERVFDLLDVVFPGIRRAARDAARLGAGWEQVSSPYVLFEGQRVVAHVGVIELPLVVMGRRAKVGSVHAVATHPDRRRRGLYRKLVEEVLEDCSTRYETLILSTGNPEYYTPFGFRVLGEHVFKIHPKRPPGRKGFRPLDVGCDPDVTLLNRLLDSREPVSEVVGVECAKAVFFVNEARRPLLYAEELDALLCMEQSGPSLALFDVVSPRMPSLAEILARMPQSWDEVILHFAPDRLALQEAAAPQPWDHGGESYLMARGPFAAESRAFMLPRTART